MEAVAARCAPIVAAASHSGNYPEVKGTVQIWNWRTGERLSEFPTVFDGLRRQALSPDGELYVAANWRKGMGGGIACYRRQTGERVWHRPELSQVQGIRFSAKGDRLWCRVEERPVHSLDAETGSILATLRGVDDVVESPVSDVALRSRKNDRYLIVGRETWEIEREKFSMSDAAFSSDACCLAEFTGSVRCVGFESTKERWRYVPPQGFHIIRLSYQSDQFFYGLLFGYQVPETALIRLSPLDGTCTELCRYSAVRRCGGVSYGAGGFGEGTFVTGGGHVVSLANGRVVRTLAFPGNVKPHSPSPGEASLRQHGFSVQQVKEWRERENRAGRASALDDFYRAHRICVACSGLGKLISGVRWRDESEFERSEAGPVAALVQRYGLEDSKNWLSDAMKWDYLYETCHSCKGRGRQF
jgi:hypothetical protein